MCLTLRFKTLEEAVNAKSTPQIAKRDITVYKILDYDYIRERNCYISPHRHFPWEMGYHYYQDTSEGLPAFSFYICSDEKGTVLLKIHEGLHAYTRLKDVRNQIYGTRRLFRMIIPKGSEYYKNSRTGEIVADNMIFYKQKPL